MSISQEIRRKKKKEEEEKDKKEKKKHLGQTQETLGWDREGDGASDSWREYLKEKYKIQDCLLCENAPCVLFSIFLPWPLQEP